MAVTNPKNYNISKTGYRALILLFKLMEKAYTRDELILYLSKNKLFKKELPKDTITNTINTLKKAGCLISRPTLRTNNKYVLKYNPLKLTLKKEEVMALQTIRDSIISLGDWELLIQLNNFYAKLATYAPDKDCEDILLYAHPLININFKILNELILCAKFKHHANVAYLSPENGTEDLDFNPEYITFENRKLYVWGNCKKYKAFSYLRIDRIKRVNLVHFQETNTNTKSITKLVVTYRLKGYSAIMYIPTKTETVINQNENRSILDIQAKVTNKFSFVQRLLSFGTDCKIIEPTEFKQEFLETLKMIKEEYNCVK